MIKRKASLKGKTNPLSQYVKGQITFEKYWKAIGGYRVLKGLRGY
jgi:hypothetical protein